jgi:beta-alanine--pyruvate transaminase
MQGAAGMIPQPDGWLKQVTEIARGHGALLIADEVMTGFGQNVQFGNENQGQPTPLKNPAAKLCSPAARKCAAGFSCAWPKV